MINRGVSENKWNAILKFESEILFSLFSRVEITDTISATIYF